MRLQIKKIYEGDFFNVERFNIFLIYMSVRRGRDGMVVGFTHTYAISAYHHCITEILLKVA